MNLTRRLNQILQVRPRQKIPQANEFAMVLVFHVDDSPSVLTATDLATIYDDGVFRPDDGEGNEVFDVGIQSAFFFVLFVIVVGVHAEAVKGELFLYTFFEGKAFFKGEGIRLCNDWDYVDNVGEFL